MQKGKGWWEPFAPQAPTQRRVVGRFKRDSWALKSTCQGETFLTLSGASRVPTPTPRPRSGWSAGEEAILASANVSRTTEPRASGGSSRLGTPRVGVSGCTGYRPGVWWRAAGREAAEPGWPWGPARSRALTRSRSLALATRRRSSTNWRSSVEE